MEKEIFRDVKGYEGLYQVSNLGNVKSLTRIDSNNHLVKERILKFGTTKKDYFFVNLCKDGMRKNIKVHRIVAEAFPEICGELFEGCEVDHIDTNRKNNNADNLRCVTKRENANNPLTKRHYSDAHKGKEPWNKGKTNIYSEKTRKKMSVARKGKKQSEKAIKKRSKPVLQLDKNTNEVLAEFPSAKEVQRQLGFYAGHVSKCCLKKPHYNTAYGYKWKFKT